MSVLLVATVSAWLFGADAALRQSGTAAPTARPTTFVSRGLSVLVQELRGPTTLLWQAPVGRSDDRVVLAALSHHDGYGPRMAFAPNQDTVALTLLPPDAPDPDTGAMLIVLNLTTGEQRVAVDGVDLRGAPVWRPDRNAIAVRRWQGATPQVTLVAPDGGMIVAADWPGALHLTPIGWDAHGRMLAAAMFADRFDLVAPFTGERIATLADGPARDFRLAAAGTHLSYLADLTPEGGVLRVIDLGRVGDALPWQQLAGGVFGSVWDADGRGITPSHRAGGALPAWNTASETALRMLPEREGVASYLDIPVAAGPDGWLAVRRITGDDLQRPAAEQLWLVRTAEDALIQGDGPVAFVGWRAAP